MLGIDARTARYTWTVALILLLFYLIYVMRTTIFVFVVALLFAYLLSPLVNFIDRSLPARRTRTAALAIAYIILLGVLFVAATQIGSRIVEQANSLAKSMPALLAKFQQQSAATQGGGSWQAQVLQKFQEQFAKSSGDLISELPRAGAKLIALASDLIYVVIVPILSFFFLKDGRAVRQHFLEGIEGQPWHVLVEDLLADVNLLLAHYMRAILLLSLATFTSFSIFFTILNIPYSFLLATLAATLEFIPMAGPLAAGVVILIVTTVSGGPILSALIFLAVYRVFQDYVLSPHLMSKGVELHPLLVIFGVFAGGEIAGAPGAFLSVPALALIRVFFRRIMTPHHER